MHAGAWHPGAQHRGGDQAQGEDAASTGHMQCSAGSLAYAHVWGLS